MSEHSKLLPCPFCGEQAITISYFNQPATKLAASCPACLAMGPVVDRAQDPYAAWNARQVNLLPELVKALELGLAYVEADEKEFGIEISCAEPIRAILSKARAGANV